MVKLIVAAFVVNLALVRVAAPQVLTDAEFACQRKVSKAAARFVKSKAKCVQRCLTNARKGSTSFSECFFPYSGATASCVMNGLSGAEDKYTFAFRTACDPTFKANTECPQCYSAGDCSTTGEASNRLQTDEGWFDSITPGVFCEQPGADDVETACEQNTMRTIVKLAGSVYRCYDRCNAAARNGVIVPGSCGPPASDPATMTCLSRASDKSIANIDRKCGDVGAAAKPDCSMTDDYPDGSGWTNLIDVLYSSFAAAIYCDAP